MQVIKIKCPECGALIDIQYKPGVEEKALVCPVCKKKHLVKEYLHRQKQTSEDRTKYDDVNEEPGRLIHVGSGDSPYQLSKGVNTIGRKAKSSTAMIQIATNDLCMSRVHAEIKVDKFHFFRVLSNKNPTMVNGKVIGLDEVLILQGGETIKMANTVLKFDLGQDSEVTIL